MMRPASAASPFYGLGWFVDSGNGTVWHSGTSPGFETLATMVPAEKKGVVVLVNGGSGVGFGETAQLRNGITARALGLDYDGEGSRLSQKALFISLVLLPFVYLLSMVWAWRHRVAIRAKSGAFGLFSLWFPLVTTLVAAWVILHLVPNLVGSPLANIRLFQPDLGMSLIAIRGDRCAVGGVQARGRLHPRIWSCPASESQRSRSDLALSGAVGRLEQVVGGADELPLAVGGGEARRPGPRRRSPIRRRSDGSLRAEGEPARPTDVGTRSSPRG